ncbi:hypothetical protein [Leifsonia sp. 71-9]|uniref:hypothetical protein n=1 Tax=Leifsonia sp. 71-9 TaxID=1895934 RepID=UPI0025BBA115|nr:hypothetical protein [Leifsonia sp. 71-9]
MDDWWSGTHWWNQQSREPVAIGREWLVPSEHIGVAASSRASAGLRRNGVVAIQEEYGVADD